MSLEVTDNEMEGESVKASDDLLLRQQVRVDRRCKLLLSLQEGVLLSSHDANCDLRSDGADGESPSKSECSFPPTTRRLRAGFRQHQAHILSLRKSLIHDQSHNLWITLGGATPSIVSE
jgi:hypothetical protein